MKISPTKDVVVVLPFIQKLYSNNIKVIGEVELAYELSNNPTFIGITGTNGKTRGTPGETTAKSIWSTSSGWYPSI